MCSAKNSSLTVARFRGEFVNSGCKLVNVANKITDICEIFMFVKIMLQKVVNIVVF